MEVFEKVLSLSKWYIRGYSLDPRDGARPYKTFSRTPFNPEGGGGVGGRRVEGTQKRTRKWKSPSYD